MMQTIMIFVIVLAAVMMTGGSLGKKITDSARDFNIPMPGAYCPGDVGVVDYKTFMKNIQLAAKVAWNGQKACWLKQELYTGTVTWEDMVNNITDATEGVMENHVDDCYQSAWSSSQINTLDEVDMVFWWDDQPVCNNGGLFTGTIGWLWDTTGSSRDTLFFYPRMEYCKGESLINWYNPPRNSNIDKFSQSKGRLNDASICRDERDSSGVGIDYSLPNIIDLTAETDVNAKNDINTYIASCSTQFKNDFMGSYSDNIDYNGYFACQNTVLIKPKADADLYEWFNSINTFSYTLSPCDLLNSKKDDINPDEFNSVTWAKGDSDANCLYMIKNRLMINQSGIENSGPHKLLTDNVYEIQPFYYFDERFYGPTGTPYDSDDIIIVIEDKT